MLILSTVSTGRAAEKPDPLVERGRTFVFNTGMCIDCHSPRDEKGQFIEDKHLMGSVLSFAPHRPDALGAGRPDDRRPGRFHHGTGGQIPDDRRNAPAAWRPRPPMPAYRLDEEDAKAVVAYLKSLKKP